MDEFGGSGDIDGFEDRPGFESETQGGGPPSTEPPPIVITQSGEGPDLTHAFMSAPLVYGPHAPAAAARSKKPLLVAGLAMVMVVGAVVIGVVSTSNSPKVPGAGVAPAAFVVSSTQATLSKHTADMVLSGSISVKGQTIPIQGTGQIDFDSNAASATASMSISSHSLVEHEVVTGGAFYMGLNVDGQSMSVLTGGPNWVDVPLPDQGSLGAGNFDPLKQIQLAEQKGAKSRAPWNLLGQRGDGVGVCHHPKSRRDIRRNRAGSELGSLDSS